MSQCVEYKKAYFCNESKFEKMNFPGTPNLYRDVKNKGVVYEVDFEVGPYIEGEVVKAQTFRQAATFQEPVEKQVKEVTVKGKFLGVRIFASDGKVKLGEFPLVTRP